MHRPGSALKEARQSATAWVTKAPESPYFVTEDGRPWTPVGQNDAITWPEFAGLYRRKSLSETEGYLRMLAESGVTCLRLMLEYSQTGYRYFERRTGDFNPHLVQVWDDIFDLCRRHGLKILLTPYDTFWMWNKWKHHPYNTCNGGPCGSRTRWLLCGETRKRIKARLNFVTERWGGDGTIFAWDLWNEMHPAHANESVDSIAEFVEDISSHLRQTERRLHGVSHLQTASVFLPLLDTHPAMAEVVFRHPSLDMVNIHLYEHGTIDDPRNTVDAAVSTGKLIAKAIAEAGPQRPVFDSEHGPIHTFKDRHRTLPDAFDEEYFRHMQWAHFATGGAGGGMRWPNRHPHSLTPGMRMAQKNLAEFLPLIDWPRFQRRTFTGSLRASARGLEIFGCGDPAQAVVYLLRRDRVTKTGMLDNSAEPMQADVSLPGLKPGAYRVYAWDTRKGLSEQSELAHFGDDHLTVRTPSFVGDLALAVTRRG